MKDEVIKVIGKTYQLKALELANETISSLCLSSCRGCAGIGRQLHPLKAKNLMSDEVLKIEWKNDIRGFKSKFIKKSRAREFNYPTDISVNTSMVRWNRSSTASLETLKLDKIGLSSRLLQRPLVIIIVRSSRLQRLCAASSAPSGCSDVAGCCLQCRPCQRIGKLMLQREPNAGGGPRTDGGNPTEQKIASFIVLQHRQSIVRTRATDSSHPRLRLNGFLSSSVGYRHLWWLVLSTSHRLR